MAMVGVGVEVSLMCVDAWNGKERERELCFAVLSRE